MKRVKYSGILATKTDELALAQMAVRVTRETISASIQQHGADSIGSVDTLYDSVFQAALAELMRLKLAENMGALMRHYKINSTASDAWEQLAISLAIDHVPAFRFASGQRRGRPRKTKGMPNALRAWKPNGRRRGAPINNVRRKQLESLLQSVVETCRRHGFRGRGSVSLALRKLGFSLTSLSKQQKRVSQAKKLFPEIADKLPR